MENKIKFVCKELDINYRELAKLLGITEGRVKQIANSPVSDQINASLDLIIENHNLKKELKDIHMLKKILKDFFKNL